MSAHPGPRESPRTSELRLGALAELVGEERERVQAPGEVRLAGQVHRSLPESRQLAHPKNERVELAAKRLPAVVAVELHRERLHRTVVDTQLAARVTARREQQQRAAPRRPELALLHQYGLPGEIGEHGQRVAELAGLEPAE